MSPLYLVAANRPTGRTWGAGHIAVKTRPGNPAQAHPASRGLYILIEPADITYLPAADA